MKKIYNAPYLKVVEVKNDIIATSSLTVDPTETTDTQYSAGRHSMWDEDFEDIY